MSGDNWTSAAPYRRAGRRAAREPMPSGGRSRRRCAALWDQVGEVDRGMLAPPFRRRRLASAATISPSRSTKPGSARSPTMAVKMFAGKRNVPEFIAARAP